MKTLVIYDSNYGNTKRIAQAIADSLGDGSEALEAGGFDESMLKGLDLLVVGSPIVAWRPTQKMRDFLNGLKGGQLSGIKSAAFDTRVKSFISGTGGEKIESALKKAGAQIISPPQKFYVRGPKGPLADGEVEKASKWGESLKAEKK